MTTQRDLLDKADHYIAGAALGMMHLPRDLNPVMVRGQGSRLWDADGKEYIDYLLGSGPMILGHAHPAVVDAVRRQVALGSTYFALNRPVIELAEKLVNAVPCGRKTYGDNAAVRSRPDLCDHAEDSQRLMNPALARTTAQGSCHTHNTADDAPRTTPSSGAVLKAALP